MIKFYNLDTLSTIWSTEYDLEYKIVLKNSFITSGRRVDENSKSDQNNNFGQTIVMRLNLIYLFHVISDCKNRTLGWLLDRSSQWQYYPRRTVTALTWDSIRYMCVLWIVWQKCKVWTLLFCISFINGFRPKKKYT